MSDPLINRNVVEYLRNNHDRSQNEIENDIIWIIRDTLTSLPEEGTELDLTHGGELIDHNIEKFEVEHPIFESIKYFSEEKFHDHCLVDYHSNQCLNDPRVDSASNHVIKEKFEDSQYLSNEHYVIESQIMCKPIDEQSHGDSLVEST